jgi:hypothetical protein
LTLPTELGSSPSTYPSGWNTLSSSIQQEPPLQSYGQAAFTENQPSFYGSGRQATYGEGLDDERGDNAPGGRSDLRLRASRTQRAGDGSNYALSSRSGESPKGDRRGRQASRSGKRSNSSTGSREEMEEDFPNVGDLDLGSDTPDFGDLSGIGGGATNLGGSMEPARPLNRRLSKNPAPMPTLSENQIYIQGSGRISGSSGAVEKFDKRMFALSSKRSFL